MSAYGSLHTEIRTLADESHEIVDKNRGFRFGGNYSFIDHTQLARQLEKLVKNEWK